MEADQGDLKSALGLLNLLLGSKESIYLWNTKFTIICNSGGHLVLAKMECPRDEPALEDQVAFAVTALSLCCDLLISFPLPL